MQGESESHALFTMEEKPKYVLKVAEIKEVKEIIQGASLQKQWNTIDLLHQKYEFHPES